jgi:predicted O-linked N-acetylglucosamine transferase (SPINDLY family)
MDAIDYRLSDARLDPEGFEDHYTERTLRLPDSFWCYDPLTAALPVGALPALERGHLTLGCLNNPCKLTGRTLSLWSGVMRALPTARLLLMVPEGRHRRHLIERLAARGIESQRVDFVAFRPRADYLRTYQFIDFGLDTFPYNGHTTSLDALWMGVPTVTRVGETCVGRGGLSQLHQLGLTELAAHSDEDFVDIAVALGTDLPRLVSLRASLRARLVSSPLMDGARFARHIEAAYRTAWIRYVRAVSSTRGVCE